MSEKEACDSRGCYADVLGMWLCCCEPRVWGPLISIYTYKTVLKVGTYLYKVCKVRKTIKKKYRVCPQFRSLITTHSAQGTVADTCYFMVKAR